MSMDSATLTPAIRMTHLRRKQFPWPIVRLPCRAEISDCQPDSAVSVLTLARSQIGAPSKLVSKVIFGGSSPLTTNAAFRLRLAFGEIGTEKLRVLVGQANSLWNEGVYETVNFATNLNESFVPSATDSANHHTDCSRRSNRASPASLSSPIQNSEGMNTSGDLPNRRRKRLRLNSSQVRLATMPPTLSTRSNRLHRCLTVACTEGSKVLTLVKRRKTIIESAKIGRISQATKIAQAVRDTRGV
jgi:hypothetical protein